MRYTKKPVTITALPWDGTEERFQEIKAMAKDSHTLVNRTHAGKVEIPTLEGILTADIGDMIIQGIKGEIYPCKPDVFAITYVPEEESFTTGLDFGEAIVALKAGFKVARAGWNGSGMFAFLVQGSTFQVNRPPLNEIYPEGTEITYRPHIDLKTADGSIATWSPSGSDALAEDWYIVQ